MNPVSSPSTVTITLTVEIPTEQVDRAIEALFEQTGSHRLDNCLYYLMHGGKHNDKAHGPFADPLMKALAALRPEAVGAYLHAEEVYKRCPWVLHCYAKLRNYEQALSDGRVVMAELYFPRTVEGRLKATGCSSHNANEMQFSYDPVEFADTYADLHAEVNETRARLMDGKEGASFYRKQADEATLMAKLIRASAGSPVEKAQMIVTLEDGKVVKTEYLPVME